MTFWKKFCLDIDDKLVLKVLQKLKEPIIDTGIYLLVKQEWLTFHQSRDKIFISSNFSEVACDTWTIRQLWCDKRILWMNNFSWRYMHVCRQLHVTLSFYKLNYWFSNIQISVIFSPEIFQTTLPGNLILVAFPHEDLDEVTLNKRVLIQILVTAIFSILSELLEGGLCCLKIMALVYSTDCYGSIELIMIQIWIMFHLR